MSSYNGAGVAHAGSLRRRSSELDPPLVAKIVALRRGSLEGLAAYVSALRNQWIRFASISLYQLKTLLTSTNMRYTRSALIACALHSAPMET